MTQVIITYSVFAKNTACVTFPRWDAVLMRRFKVSSRKDSFKITNSNLWADVRGESILKHHRQCLSSSSSSSSSSPTGTRRYSWLMRRWPARRTWTMTCPSCRRWPTSSLSSLCIIIVKMMIMISIGDFDMPELFELINSDNHIIFGNNQSPNLHCHASIIVILTSPT